MTVKEAIGTLRELLGDVDKQAEPPTDFIQTMNDCADWLTSRVREVPEDTSGFYAHSTKITVSGMSHVPHIRTWLEYRGKPTPANSLMNDRSNFVKSFVEAGREIENRKGRKAASRNK